MIGYLIPADDMYRLSGVSIFLLPRFLLQINADRNMHVQQITRGETISSTARAFLLSTEMGGKNVRNKKCKIAERSLNSSQDAVCPSTIVRTHALSKQTEVRLGGR